MKHIAAFAAALALVVAGCRGHDEPQAPASSAPAAVAANPVQAEMRLLTAAMQVAVQAIGLGDVREVGHALHQVHEAKQATAAALAGGSYRTPKNGDQVERFRELDEAFHQHLARIVVASRTNDIDQTAQAVGKALAACNGCHAEFRPAPTGGS